MEAVVFISLGNIYYVLILTCSLAVILSGGAASANGAFTQGSQSDGDTSNTTVSLAFPC